jgi:hypothetical protein
LTQKTYEPGIYFGMPDEEYHTIPLLSASGMKQLLISPMDFWARSWMNPRKAEEEDSVAKMLGKAYHKRILEGPDNFKMCYAPTFNPEDLENVLETIQDMKDVLIPRGVSLKSTARHSDYKQAVIDLNAGYTFVSDEREKYEFENMGKVFLSQEQIDKIHVAAAMIEQHPELSKCVQGGYPEVTIIWKSRMYDVLYKARLDYLKVRMITDLKTFTNTYDTSVERAIYKTMASRKYHIQAAHYLEAVDNAIELARDGFVFGDHDPEFINNLKLSGDHKFVFIFQQKGIAPLARGHIFERGSSMHGAGVAAIDDATKQFMMCMDKYGIDPWVDDTPIKSLEDGLFPVYAMEL